MIFDEITQSLERLRNLKSNFNEAGPAFLDVIIYGLMAEEARYSALLREAKERRT